MYIYVCMYICMYVYIYILYIIHPLSLHFSSLPYLRRPININFHHRGWLWILCGYSWLPTSKYGRKPSPSSWTYSQTRTSMKQSCFCKRRSLKPTGFLFFFFFFFGEVVGEVGGRVWYKFFFLHAQTLFFSLLPFDSGTNDQYLNPETNPPPPPPPPPFPFPCAVLTISTKVPSTDSCLSAGCTAVACASPTWQAASCPS